MSRHKTGYVISYHGILCHDMSYVMTITASLVHTISMQAILLYLTHGDHPNKLLNHFIPLVTDLLILILIDLDAWTEILPLN